MTNWARTVMMLAAVLLAATLTNGGVSRVAFSASKARVAFEMQTGFVSVAFDIGQKCSKMNSVEQAA